MLTFGISGRRRLDQDGAGTDAQSSCHLLPSLQGATDDLQVSQQAAGCYSDAYSDLLGTRRRPARLLARRKDLHEKPESANLRLLHNEAINAGSYVLASPVSGTRAQHHECVFRTLRECTLGTQSSGIRYPCRRPTMTAKYGALDAAGEILAVMIGMTSTGTLETLLRDRSILRR